ncbi:MAG: hypothetical protein NT033_07435, partial [Candidatus Omnitrophica bacterium]|nr:hypothetical protein [Candidatus Omnitrophota bacterium]
MPFGIANRTITTKINAQLQEELYAFADFTKISPNGDITYRVQKGINGLRLQDKPLDNHKKINSLLDAYLRRGVRLFSWIEKVWEEHKDNMGRVRLQKDYGQIDKATGFMPANAMAQSIAFIDYDNFTGAFPEASCALMGIGNSGYSYAYNGSDEPAAYRDSKWLSRNTNRRFVVADYNGEKTPIVLFDTEDTHRDKKSLCGQAMLLNGELYAEFSKGERGAWLISNPGITFFKDGFASTSDKIKTQNKFRPWQVSFDTALADAGNRTPYRRHYIFALQSQDGYYWVWDRDVKDNTMGYEFEDWVKGAQVRGNAPAVTLLPAAEAEKFAQRNGVLYYQRTKVTEAPHMFFRIYKKGSYGEGLKRQIKDNNTLAVVGRGFSQESLLGMAWSTLTVAVTTVVYLIVLFLSFTVAVSITKWWLRLTTRRKPRLNSWASAPGGTKSHPAGKCEPSEPRFFIEMRLAGFNYFEPFTQYLMKKLTEANYSDGDTITDKANALKYVILMRDLWLGILVSEKDRRKDMFDELKPVVHGRYIFSPYEMQML